MDARLAGEYPLKGGRETIAAVVDEGGLATASAARGPLALFGGPPAFAEPLHVGRPNLGDRQAYLDHIEGMLDRRWLTNDGELVRDFERRVADLVGVRHCVAMCNATVALEIVIRALGMTGEVIVPSFTFIATAHA
ncbi:MAG TPA: DegT/DnrJ/EryC1/StrS family aminotransferase, partial [Pirellulales bacterium]|nr:DegT/DnrJ/EryC1/StrS family aminotransferase [Pirellulales bacterium]